MGQPKDLSLECDVVEVKIYSILHMYHNTSTSIYSPNLKTRKYNKKILPVILSHRMRDVIIRPNGLKRASRSCWVMFFGKPETYKFAPLMASELGLA